MIFRLIKKILKKILPYRVIEFLKTTIEFLKTIYYVPQYKQSIRRLNAHDTKRPIEAAIFIMIAENWNSFESVYRCMSKDSRVNITVYVFPGSVFTDKLGELNLKVYNEVLAFFSERGINTVKAYDIESCKYISPESVKADYIFYDEPYEIYVQKFRVRDMYKSAKICYIPYGYSLTKSKNMLNITLPVDTFRFIYAFFAPSEISASFVEKIYDRVGHRYHNVLRYGYPRFDLFAEMQSHSSSGSRGENFTVLWNPRFTLSDENNGDPSSKTTFFEFREKIMQRTASQQNEYWIIRPHPRAFSEYINRGMMTQAEVDEYISSLDKNPRAELDRNKDYLDAFTRSDAMLADFSSFLIEYAAMGKPIIYCGNHEAIPYDEMLEAMYLPNSWHEAMSILENLKKGIDPLSDKRKKFAEKVLSGGKSGERIVQFLIDDFIKGGSI